MSAALENELRNSLRKLIVDEIEVIRRLAIALESEQHLLIAGKTDELPASASRKAGLLSQITSLEQIRSALLLKNGLGTGREAIEQFLASNPMDQDLAELIELWENLLSVARRVHADNETNGRLIGSRLQQTQQALAILVSDSGSAAPIYGANGQHSGVIGVIGRREIGKA